MLTWKQQANHMQIGKHGHGYFTLHFDTSAFYDDLVAVCRAAIAKTWNGHVMNRYNGWLIYDLDQISNQRKLSRNERDGITEINDL